MGFLRRSRLAAVVVVVVALAAAGIAYAQIPDSAGAIHGCYMKSGGNLRVIDNSVTKCKSTETSLNWNQRGVTGPTGAKGATGDNGTNGTNGAPGARGETGPAGPSFLAGSSGDNLVHPDEGMAVGVGTASESGGSFRTPLPVAGTLSHLHVTSSGASATGSLTATVYVNDLPTSLTCTISGSFVFDCSDTTHTVSFKEGDSVYLDVSNGFSGAVVGISWSVRTS